MNKPATLELAPFIMDDRQATPGATEQALRDGLTAAQRKGDVLEAKRIENHLGDAGPTGLRYSHRQRRIDPVEELITDRRLRHAAQMLRTAAEGLETGRDVRLEPFKEPKNPPIDPDDNLPSIKNPPSPPDPKNRWTKAKRTLDAHGNKVDCPPTWPPKPVKPAKGMPKQFIAEAVYAAIRRKEGDDRRKVLWRVALNTFATWPMREAIWGIIMERRSLGWACKHTDLSVNGRHRRIIKLNLVAALDRVAQHLEEGA